MYKKIAEIIEQAIEQRLFPGCLLGIVNSYGQRYVEAFGRFTYSKQSPAVRVDSIYDIASLTKVIPTACLAIKFIEEHQLVLDELLIKYVPAYTGSYSSEIRIRHLLTHTLDFGFPLSSIKDRNPNEILKVILSAGLRSRPGTVFCYSNATSILLGLAIEAVAAMPLDKAAHRYFFGPLNMKDTSFFPNKLDFNSIVPTEIDLWRNREIRAEVHDESAYALRPILVAGSAGVFSNVPDLLNFLEMILAKGTFRGERFFASETVTLMHENQISSIGLSTGLGWELNQRIFMGSKCSNCTFGKTGFTGCMLMVDPVKGKAMVLLSNHTYPHRRPDREPINSFRREIADIVFSD